MPRCHKPPPLAVVIQSPKSCECAHQNKLFAGIWSTLDIFKLLGLNPTTDLEVVTNLSNSNTTHPLLQTVVDGRADVAPFEFGITLNRHKTLGKYKMH